MGMTHDMIDNLRVSDALRLLKGAKLVATNSAGTEVEVSVDDLAGLSTLSDELALVSGLTATAAELNAAADLSVANEIVTATNVITAAESGKTFFLNAAAGFVSTLPAPALGLAYEFIVITAPTTNGYDIATNGGADIMKGLGFEAEVDTADDGPVDQNADNLNLAANVALAGDWVKVRSDGTSWFYTSGTAADGGLVASTT